MTNHNALDALATWNYLRREEVENPEQDQPA
jgi:hypothetical protein